MKLLSSARMRARFSARVLGRVCLTLVICVPFLSVPSPALAVEGPPVLLRQWGSSGSGDGQFAYPHGICIDADGNIYVADTQNYRIQKFDRSGTLLAKWGSQGSEAGEFDTGPFGVAVDTQGNVYAVDKFSYRVQKFAYDADAEQYEEVLRWGSKGTANGQFDWPSDIAVDLDGNVYVADTLSNRVQKFDSDGGWLATWGPGSGDDEFSGPAGIFIGGDSNVYVAEMWNNRIHKTDDEGGFLAAWGTYGDGDGEYDAPMDVTTDPDGNIYVCDYFNHRIQKLDSDGTFLTKWGAFGSSDGQFRYPTSAVCDEDGNLYVVDLENARIQVFGYSQTVDFDIQLTAGWNLISVPVVPEDSSVEAVFWDSVIVYTWDADEQAYVQVHEGGDLTDVEPGRAYWVKVTAEHAGTLPITGTPVPAPEDFEFTLSAGWNMFGSVYHDATEIYRDNLSVVGEPDPDPLQRTAIYWWHATNKQYVLLEDDPIVPGVGYWLASATNCTMTMAPPGV